MHRCTLLHARKSTHTAINMLITVTSPMPAQQHCALFRFRRAVFYNGLKSKVGLAAAKTAAMRIDLNIDGCGVVAPPVHSSSRAPLLLANLLAHILPLPRAAQ